MASDDPEDDNPLQRWIDAEERWGDPEERWGNPEAAFGDAESGLDDPEAELSTAPETPETSGEGRAAIDVDSRTSRYFWGAVALANVAVGAVSIGLMLIGFRGNWELGGGLVLIGLLAGARTYWIYRSFRNDEQLERAKAGGFDGEDAADAPDSDR